MDARSKELEAMKRIDLRQYAMSRGFVLDRRQSSRCSSVMRHSNGDKLIVAKRSNGQFVYFNAVGNDNGTIIDLIQTRDRISLGEVRKLLRPWICVVDSPPPDLPTLPIELQPSEHDAGRVLKAWMSARPIGKTHAYLETQRCVPRSILVHPIFQDRIRRDLRMNAVFPHFNQAGLCGFELKNADFTGFSSGGLKGLACSRPEVTDHKMVICETAIDMLSYAALHGVAEHRFFSTAGQISPSQAECLRSAASRMPSNSSIILAMDHDEGGHELAEQIQEALSESTLPIRQHVPSRSGDDWNDVLQQQSKQQPLPPAVSP